MSLNTSDALPINNTVPLHDFMRKAYHLPVVQVTFTILALICICCPLFYKFIPWCRLRWSGYRRLGKRNAYRSIEMKEFEVASDVLSFYSTDDETPLHLPPST